MFRRTIRVVVGQRPATALMAVGSNRLLEEPFYSKAQDIFAVPPFPHKRVMHNWRFYIKPGKASIGPPIGQEFSKIGLKAVDFTKAFNDRTKGVFKDDVELICRVQVYFDKTYTFRIEPPPTAWFLLRAMRKKRHDTGAVGTRGHWCGYITLEMIYEIAKMKQFNWSTPEYPMIEKRVQRIISQARGMGICVLGVDAPSSPVKGCTPAEYEEQSAKYRAEQMKQYLEFKAQEILRAPLIERLHRPDVFRLSPQSLKEALADPKLLDTLYTATHPKSQFHNNDEKRRAAQLVLDTMGWHRKRGLSDEELVGIYRNWRVPSLELMRRMEGVPQPSQTFWSRGS